MRFSVNPLVVLAALASQTLATVFVTTPTSSSSFEAGKSFSVVWQNNGVAPTEFGFADIGLYVGSTTIQEQVVQLATSVNVTNTTTLNVTIDPSAGANYGKYFVRFTSISAQDPNNTAEPAEAFSALFGLTGMTGTFSATQQSAIDATNTNSSSPTAAPAASAPNTPSSSSNNTLKASTGSSTTPSAPAKTSTTPSQHASGAISTSINFALFGTLLLGGAGYLL